MVSGVNRQEIYRIMPKLQNNYLVEKMIGIPTKWRATPLHDGLSILLENRKNVISELQTEATTLINYIEEKKERAELRDNESQIVMLPGKNAHLKWLKNRFKHLQKNVDAICTWSDEKVVRYYCSKEIKKHLNKGLKFRVIIYVSENEKIY